MPQPSSTPEWASTGTRVTPATAKQQQGWITGEKAPAQWLNWWMNLVYLWVVYLKNLTGEVLTWTAKQTFNVDGDGWVDLPLSTSWVHANGGVNTRKPQYRLDSFGRVWLRGEASWSGGGTPATRVALLPTTLAPPNFRGGYWFVYGNSFTQPVLIQIGGATSSGLITPGEIQAPTNPSDVCFDGICFYINGK